MSKEQVELRNELLKQKPNLSEGELLKEIAPEALKTLPEDFIAHLCQVKAYSYDPEEPVIYLCSMYGPFPPEWQGKRIITFDEQGNPIFGLLIEKESGSPRTTGSASVHAMREIWYSGYPWRYQASWVAAFDEWEWDEDYVLSVTGRAGDAGSNTALHYYIDGEWLWKEDCTFPCTSCEWGHHESCHKEDEGGNWTHQHQAYSAIDVHPDGWWYCSYGYVGPWFFQCYDYPESGWHHKS
jgi:hypothetical protein